MTDDEAVTLAHNAMKDARKHLDAAMAAIHSTAIVYARIKDPIREQITAAAHNVDDAIGTVRKLVADQSAWGKYDSHPGGNSN